MFFKKICFGDGVWSICWICFLICLMFFDNFGEQFWGVLLRWSKKRLFSSTIWAHSEMTCFTTYNAINDPKRIRILANQRILKRFCDGQQKQYFHRLFGPVQTLVVLPRRMQTNAPKSIRILAKQRILKRFCDGLKHNIFIDDFGPFKNDLFTT